MQRHKTVFFIVIFRFLFLAEIAKTAEIFQNISLCTPRPLRETNAYEKLSFMTLYRIKYCMKHGNMCNKLYGKIIKIIVFNKFFSGNSRTSWIK